MDVASQSVRSDYVACSACGATHAKPNSGHFQRESFGLCESCVSDLHVQNGGRFDENDLNRLLAARLRNAIVKKSKGRTIGRCEAVTSAAVGSYQCAQHAQTTIAGRRVCTQHAKSQSTRFVTEGLPSKHSPIISLLRLLAERDASFSADLIDLSDDLLGLR